MVLGSETEGDDANPETENTDTGSTGDPSTTDTSPSSTRTPADTDEPATDSSPQSDGNPEDAAAEGRINVGEPIAVSPGGSVDGVVTVDVDEDSVVTVHNNSVHDGIELTVTGIDPSPDTTLESIPPAWSWAENTTVSISYTVSAGDGVEPGSYSVPVSLMSVPDDDTREVMTDIDDIDRHDRNITVHVPSEPERITADPVSLSPGESNVGTVQVDVSKNAFLTVKNNFVRDGIEVTITEIKPSPDATLESIPPSWSWIRDTQVSITYEVSVDEAVAPGTYSLPVSMTDNEAGDSSEDIDIHVRP